MSRRSTRNTAGPSEIIGTPLAQAHMMPSIASAPLSSSPYLQNYYSHPASTRLLLGNISQSTGKLQHAVGGAVPKPPKPPEKPLMPYMRYSRKVWDDVKAGNPDLKLWEIGKIIGQQWRELPQSDRQQFIEEYEVEKIEHLEQLKLYHNSPAYQAYLHAKTRAEALEASADGLGGDKDDAYMSIEPTDDGADDSDMCFSVKHVAAARFQRNHRLINDILGETIHVPSTRAVVTTSRLNVLKSQVNSLEVHQKKLETELAHLEDAHTQKKRKLIMQARDFEKEIKRLREISPPEYYKEYKLKQQQALQKQQEEAKAEKEAKEKSEESQNKEQKGDEKKDDENGGKEKESDEKDSEPNENTETKEEQEETNKDGDATTATKDEEMEVETTDSKQEESAEISQPTDKDEEQEDTGSADTQDEKEDSQTNEDPKKTEETNPPNNTENEKPPAPDIAGEDKD